MVEVVVGDQRQLRSALEEAGVVAAYLFGSRAAGTQRPASDADVAVLMGRRPGLLERARLADLLAQALQVPDVDLVVLDEATLELRGRVLQEGRLIFSSDESRRVAFEVRTRSEYFDFLPTLQAHTRRYIRQVAEHGLFGS